LRPDIQSLYRSTKHPIAFIDESFETRGPDSFYILAIVLVEPARLDSVRQRVAKLNSGHAIHASDLGFKKAYGLLDDSVALLANDHDSADIIYARPFQNGDITGEKTRQLCLQTALSTLHREFETELFVLDSRRLKDADESDRRTAGDLRKVRKLSRNARLLHVWPAEELLLSLADILAWTYRQKLTNRDSRWFSALEAEVKVTRVGDS
jgi:hypothetical protein